MSWDTAALLAKIEAKLRDRGIVPEVIRQHLNYHKAVIEKLRARYEPEYGVADLCGMGGSGTVLVVSTVLNIEAEQAVPVQKCVKYPQPILDHRVSLNLAAILDNEAKKLVDLHHQNIVPLEDAGTFDLGDVEGISEINRIAPFYMMPFVDALDLEQYLASSYATAEALCQILADTAAAVAYVHDAGYVHLDIKPQNIFIQNYRATSPIALLADFGFCKKIRVGSASSTLVIGTDGYIHPDLLVLMKNRTTTNPNRVRDNVPTNVLDPRFDRFSFGVTIINSLVTFLRNQPDSISRTFPVGRLRALQLVALRCSDGSPDALRILDDQSRIATPKLFCKETASALKYEDSQSLASNLSNVSTGFKNYALEEEITAAGSEIVCLPPRSFAPFNKRVQNAFDSTPVRRLANISQLALCYHVYPGASFTRKEHTLGTFEVVTRLLRHVLLDKQNPTASLILTSKHQRLALLGALLHDIAHIPLMHEFEDAVPELKQEKYIRTVRSFRRVQFTPPASSSGLRRAHFPFIHLST